MSEKFCKTCGVELTMDNKIPHRLMCLDCYATYNKEMSKTSRKLARLRLHLHVYGPDRCLALANDRLRVAKEDIRLLEELIAGKHSKV